MHKNMHSLDSWLVQACERSYTLLLFKMYV